MALSGPKMGPVAAGGRCQAVRIFRPPSPCAPCTACFFL